MNAVGRQGAVPVITADITFHTPRQYRIPALLAFDPADPLSTPVRHVGVGSRRAPALHRVHDGRPGAGPVADRSREGGAHMNGTRDQMAQWIADFTAAL